MLVVYGICQFWYFNTQTSNAHSQKNFYTLLFIGMADLTLSLQAMTQMKPYF